MKKILTRAALLAGGTFALLYAAGAAHVLGQKFR